MKIVQDPSVYGYKAETGLFIPTGDFSLLPGLLKSIRSKVQRKANKASYMYERYKDIHESGDATSRQCTLMDKWRDNSQNLEGIINTLTEFQSFLERKEAIYEQTNESDA
ncbi:hypothetical protein [Prevotella intermedia]|jgi:hypothetical protein|uniref:Uncharacterized protein n=1 Tax=Prevotella intermedia TaxID=28131 RepID=A0A2D3L774_PREIN|nr:hypothetical protein [Prevotella intermedia]ATV26381.1 hypothetical protein CTM62_06395 [Prevotella intermedia]